ncbi:hypothetical protein KGF56_000014 [Candida oxycetoniae]|uniref:Oxidoreductase n=1 Tax=Candida oxycetoniae TaxID=497107 RepID=A0AAI9T2A0_9ASCO|nr:uncharacterized protein KGF56_000014 [Candida oxycetoniae]KAI3407174.2 hypothetical protein KGF56_000014 [Candida oxycetoniae]
MSYPVIPRKSWAEWKQMVHGFWPGNPQFTEKDYPDLEGKVVIVTGGNTGVGYQTVKSLAGTTKAKLYIFSRNKEKTLKAIEQIQSEISKEYNVDNREINFIPLDLGNLTTIKSTVDQFLKQEDRLDIIIHNAGVMVPPKGSKTTQGYELQLGTNTIGPHLLQKLLDPIFIKTSELNPSGLSRIVWVSSSAHFFAPIGGLYWQDYNFEKIPFTKSTQMYAYGQSKAGNIIQAKMWSKKHTAPNVISSSICPGYLLTDLQRYQSPMEVAVFKYMCFPARFGAYTELYAALSPDVKDGQHSVSFGTPGIARNDLNDVVSNEKVWDWLEQQVEPYLT